ncbi:hypothetical protein RCL1_006870 [Eukaryota sp. TZLM3-RCL]
MTEKRKRRSSEKDSTKPSKKRSVEDESAAFTHVSNLVSPNTVLSLSNRFEPQEPFSESPMDIALSSLLNDKQHKILFQISKNIDNRTLSKISNKLVFNFNTTNTQSQLIPHPTDSSLELLLCLEEFPSSGPLSSSHLICPSEDQTLILSQPFTHLLRISPVPKALKDIERSSVDILPPPIVDPDVLPPTPSPPSLNVIRSSSPSPPISSAHFLPKSAFKHSKSKSKKDKDKDEKKKKKKRSS